jgi:hypothetical protein
MVDMATYDTTKIGLRLSRTGIYCRATRASLRAVRGRHFNKETSRPGEFIPQHFNQPSPTGVQNAAIQTSLVSASFGGHSFHVQSLDDYRAVALGVGIRDSVKKMIALSPHLTVQFGYSDFCFFSIFRAFLPSGNDTLSVSQTSKSAFQKSRVFDFFTVAVSNQKYNAAIDGNVRLVPQNWICLFNFAGNYSKPLIDVLRNGTCLWRSFERPMLHNPHRPKFGESQIAIVEPPSLWMWLTRRNAVATSTFPARSSSELLKATLPCLVQFDKKLRTDVSGNLGKPWQFRSQSSQVVDLIERGIEFPLITRPCKSDEALFISEVPEKPQDMCPSLNQSLLFGGWINPKTKSLMSDHALQLITKPDGLSPVLKGGVSAQETR